MSYEDALTYADDDINENREKEINLTADRRR